MDEMKELYTEVTTALPDNVRQQKDEGPHERVQLMYEAQKALLEWKDAAKFFESASDPDLIDVAIFDMEAAKRRYLYLLKQLRGMNG